MPLIQYENKRLGSEALGMIEKVNVIIKQYQAQGYDMTLRQVYYQLVSKDWIPNQPREYDRLGRIISDGRRAGLIDWHAIVDRTRNLKGIQHWDSPTEIIDAVRDGYRRDKWETQDYRVEVWIEKDALAGVFQRICNQLDVPYFACRGYPSDSETWAASQRFGGYIAAGQTPIILHFGDHDPSGIDMTRDIIDKMQLFGCYGVEVRRLALSMEQVEEFSPPPNPAKTRDPRFQSYQDTYGDESWELDALRPDTLAGIVRDEVESLIDQDAWDKISEEEEIERDLLGAVANNWTAVKKFCQKFIR
jgi:hypothetical protein